MAVGAYSCRIIVGAELDAGDIADQHASAGGIGLHDDIAKLLGSLKARLGGNRRVEHLAVRLRKPADFTRGHFGILVLDRGDHVAGNQPEARQLVRIEPDPHRIGRAEHVDVADAGYARQLILDVRGQPVGNIEVGAAVGGVTDRHDHQQVR